MTPASMIYNGFRKKYPEPFLYHTKNGKGEEVTKEVYFADPMKNKFYQPTAEGRCNLCGEPLKDGGIPVKKCWGRPIWIGPYIRHQKKSISVPPAPFA